MIFVFWFFFHMYINDKHVIMHQLHFIESESTKLLEQMKVLEDRVREIKAAKVNL